ncbi:MAG: cysteine desulfurase NifS, partial [Lachnospiraceae bacterium]|nr:cysteine desulfurase NifS [Lachnospiraceae bacterium]
LSLSFGGVEATSVLVFLDLAGIAASGGSACSSAENKPSAVLQAIGVDEPYLSGTVRLTLSEDNTKAEADYVIQVLKETIGKLRR